VDEIINEITDSIDLDKPGAGIAFTLPLDRVVGISHSLLDEGELETNEEKDAPDSVETDSPAGEAAQSGDKKTDTPPDGNSSEEAQGY
jgi:hypothetical protein